MFTLNKTKFKDLNLSNAKEFIESWSSYYHYPIKAFNSEDDIKYLDELNLSNDLTERNVKNLLRWKDPMRLTEEILSGPNQGCKNKKVMRVLKKLREINEFRHGQEEES